MDRYEFVKELYYQETGRQTSLNDSLNIPIGILSGILAVIFIYVTGFDYGLNVVLSAVFIVCIGIFAFLGLATGYYLSRSYNDLTAGYKYLFLENATNWNNHYNSLKTHFETHKEALGAETEENTLKQFKIDLMANYAMCIDRNIYNNDKKSGYLHTAKQYLFRSLIAGVLTFIPFGINYFTKQSPAYKVELTNSQTKNNKMIDDKQVPPPPTPPQPREIKEGQIPKLPQPPEPPKK